MLKYGDSDTRFVGFNKYTKQPIRENTSRNWVMNGRNNENYKYIIDRYNGSTTNKAVNNAYVDLAYGRGLSIHDEEEDGLLLQAFSELMTFKEVKAVVIDYQILGELSIVVHRQKSNRKKLAKLEHISKSNVIPSVEDDDGVIRSYWYSADWTKQYQAKFKPVEYPAFGFAEDFGFEKPEIYVGMPYQIGQEYFANPDYDACLQYAGIEEELSNYYFSHIVNGLSFGSIVNIPNSAHWSDSEKDKYIADTQGKLGGSSNANKQAFNFKRQDSEDTTIVNVENNTAHKQWEFLGAEASNKILSGHKCMSPALVGLGSSSGFASVADEMDMMEKQLMKRVIAPKQDFILDSIFEILKYFGLSYDLYFRPLTEIEGEDEEAIKSGNEIETTNEVSLVKKKTDLDNFLELGEDEDLESYNILDEIEVDYNEEDSLQFVSTGTARPNAKSSQDGEDFIVRYRYVGNKTPERSFCKAMMSANKVYRKEDIIQLENKVVNEGWGPNGVNTYSIWLYKGGGNCHHKFNRVIYLKKGKNVDPNSPLAQIISTSEARRRGFRLETNDTLVSIEPRNMTNEGFLKPRK